MSELLSAWGCWCLRCCHHGQLSRRLGSNAERLHAVSESAGLSWNCWWRSFRRAAWRRSTAKVLMFLSPEQLQGDVTQVHLHWHFRRTTRQRFGLPGCRGPPASTPRGRRRWASLACWAPPRRQWFHGAFERMKCRWRRPHRGGVDDHDGCLFSSQSAVTVGRHVRNTRTAARCTETTTGSDAKLKMDRTDIKQGFNLPKFWSCSANKI